MFFKKNAVKLTLPAFTLGVLFAACSNGESISNAKVESVADAEFLPECDRNYEGEMVLVKSDSSIRVCENKKWTKISQNPESSFSSSERDVSFELKGGSIWGNAIKGPYEVSSVVTLKEMRILGDSLSYTGRSYAGGVSGLKGSFVIPNVTLNYPYAEVSVTGKWLNEVTGELSSEEMTLYALADLSDGSTEVNVNILTHIEYERVKVLVKKGYSVQAAKKQAENEIVSALGFSTDMGYFEKLSAFATGNIGNNDAANATLLAISLLFIRDNDTDAKIKESIQKFANDIASDGKWNDADGEKEKMVTWAENFDVEASIDNIKAWGVLDVPEYDKYFGVFWNNYYGLGSCSILNEGDVRTARKNDKGVHYICKNRAYWNEATTIEWEPYGWNVPGKKEPKGRAAESGNVYIYDKSLPGWRLPVDDFEYDTYDFTEPNDKDDKADFVRMGHKTKQCYVYEKKFPENEDSEYAWTVEPEEIADTIYVFGKSDADLVTGGCSGKKYARSDNQQSWRPAAEMEIYVGYACSDNFRTLNMLMSHRYATQPRAKDSIFVCKNNKWTWIRNAEYTLGSLKDTRDGKVYTTVKIGSQNWMAEDLKYCPEGEECMDGYYSYEQLSDVCPEGWHVPQKEEFELLLVSASGASSFDEIENNNDLGFILGIPDNRYVTGMSESEINNTAFNWYGFSATKNIYWTTSTNTNGEKYYTLNLYHEKAVFEMDEKYYKAAIRCVENTAKK